MKANLSYFDVAVQAATRAAICGREVSDVPVLTEDVTERAMFNVYDALGDFERETGRALSSERSQQLQERAKVLMQLWERQFEVARDKALALKECGL